MHDAYIGGLFQQTKITRKASDVAENLQLYRVVRFFHPRFSWTMTHILADVQRITLNVSCMTISGGRTKLHIPSAMSLALRVIFPVSELWNLFLSQSPSLVCSLCTSVYCND